MFGLVFETVYITYLITNSQAGKSPTIAWQKKKPSHLYCRRGMQDRKSRRYTKGKGGRGNYSIGHVDRYAGMLEDNRSAVFSVTLKGDDQE